MKAVIDANCASCHSGNKASAGVRLDSYARVSAAADRSLAAIKSGKMPPSGPMSAASVKIIEDWIAGGKQP
ncbi:MAG: hypothetical protein HUU06_02185 [Planctomycetaceae bacterium]|nr:hypothetical protein [Planctomycetota bacterium]NUN51582.1 hypothetical protein [Planctomycetaceae bacterium]